MIKFSNGFLHEDKIIRDDIQTLRAIAICLVILFHYKIKPFIGGFLGVDIFFTISGFLITQKLLTSESLIKIFLEKRIKRIFPALFIVLLISYITAFIIFPPLELVDLSYSLLFSIIPAQNFYLLHQVGYFDKEAELKPFLIFWSLAIEEQYYLIWPFILFIAIKRIGGYISLLVFVSVLALISLGFSEFFARNNREIAFYAMPLRAYELFIGGLVYLLSSILKIKNIKLHLLTPVTGLLAILISTFYFSENNIFPGVNALPPIIGASLILLYFTTSQPTTIIRIFFFNFITNFFGKISYSLYLVHWPLLVFYCYFSMKSIGNLNLIETISLIATTIFLSILIFYGVEQPFRYEKFNSTKWITLLSATILFVGLAFLTIYKDGFYERYSAEKQKALNYLKTDYKTYTWKNFLEYTEYSNYNLKSYNEQPIIKRGMFSQGKTNLIIIGDSQAGDFINILVEAKIPNIEIRTIPISAGCQSVVLPLEEYRRYVKNNIPEMKQTDIPYCEEQHSRFYRSKIISQADIIFLVAHYYDWAVKYLPVTINFLNKNGARKVYVIGLKNQTFEPDKIINSIKYQNINFLDSAIVITNDKIFKTIQPDTYLSITEAFCPIPPQCSLYTPDGYPLFFDKIHLTPVGAKYIANQLINKQWFNSLGIQIQSAK
jgi:peptidoglycan/LPS O-acetylase OafA/YrhL